MHADWPGLGDRALFEGRDLKPTLDTRAVLKAAIAAAFDLTPAQADRVFPGSERRARRVRTDGVSLECSAMESDAEAQSRRDSHRLRADGAHENERPRIQEHWVQWLLYSRVLVFVCGPQRGPTKWDGSCHLVFDLVALCVGIICTPRVKSSRP